MKTNNAATPIAGVRYNTTKKKLCTVDSSGKELVCNPNVCSFGQSFKTKGHNGQPGCVDNPCSNSNCKTCIRGICADNVSYPTTTKPKFILTNYAVPSNTELSKYIKNSDCTVTPSDAYKNYVSDMITNFCVPNGVDIFTLYIYRIVGAKKDKCQSYIINIPWLYNNYIKICDSNGIVPGLNVFPSFKYNEWGGNKSWQEIGTYVGQVNDYAHKMGSKGLQYMVFDAEDCGCGDIGDIDTTVRDPFKQAYNKSGQTLTNDFIIMSSNGVGFSLQGKEVSSSGYPSNIGLGEIYWNVAELWPCVGNDLQYDNYSQVCKANNNKGIGSAYNSFKDNPEALVDYLIAASKQESSGGILTNIYSSSHAKDKVNVIPLLSTEALYSQTSGPTTQMCTALAYSGKTNIPTPGDKICGTFDGFSTWTWDNYKKFMIAFANRFNLPYIGIYDAMFIPKAWMKNKKFNNASYQPNLPQKWPLICSDPNNQCATQCIQTKILPCKDNNDCTRYLKKYCPKVTGMDAYCRTNKFCHFG